MKRFCLLLLTCCVLLTACGGSGAETDPITTSSGKEQPPGSSNTEAVSSDAALPIQEALSNPIKGHLLPAAPLRFTQVLGKRKRFENSLPPITVFQYPFIYYERMGAAVENSEDPGSLLIGKYSLESNANQEITTIPFAAMMEYSQLLIDNRYLFYLLCQSDAEGQLYLEISLFDLEKNTRKVICTSPTRNVFSYSKQLNADEVVFFFYKQVGLSGIQQQVIKYNLIEDRITVLYEGELMDWSSEMNSTKDIWSIDAANNQIYLLLHQLVDGKMKTYLRTLNENGKQLEEQEISALQIYNTVDQTIDNMAVENDYIFVNYYQFRLDEEHKTNPPSAILRKSGDDITLLDIGTVYPKRLLNRHLIEGRYLVFSTYSQPSDLFLLDVVEGKITLKSLDLDSDTLISIACDDQGNIVTFTKSENGENSEFFLYKKEDIFIP